MNLFLLDEDLDKCAQAHIDKHVSKMQLQAAQMLTTAIWVDKFLGFIPRNLTKQQLIIINKQKKQQPSIQERTFTRYLPTHINHPSTVWVRSSLQNYKWTFNYIAALNDQCAYRGYKSPSVSFLEVCRLPQPEHMQDLGLTQFALAMKAYPQCVVQGNPIQSYRNFYRADKKQFATWKNRQKPNWWKD